MIALFLSTVNSSLERTKEIESIAVSYIFEDVIKKDRYIRIEGYDRMIRIPETSHISHDSLRVETVEGVILYKKKTDTLPGNMSIEDKEFAASQLYLMPKYPINAFVLDSMLQVELRSKGIIAHTAVSYKGKLGSVVHKEFSTHDGFPLPGSQSLFPINISIPAMGFEIMLEGYVKYPLSYLLNKTPNLILITFVYFIPFISFVTFAILCVKIKRRTTRLALPNDIEFVPYEEIESTLQHVAKAIASGAQEEFSEKSDFEIQLTECIFINKNTGEIRKKNEIVYQLKDLQFTLFLFLLDKPDFFQSLEDIKEIVWRNKNVDNAVVNRTAGRLRRNLKSASVPLDIKNIRSRGYQIKKR